MGNAQVEVVAACLGVTLYTSLGFFGASRVWASRFSVMKGRSPRLAILSGAMNVVSVVVLLAQVVTRSAGGVFPCGITSTMSHLYVLLCVLPLVIRKSEDSAIWKFLPCTRNLAFFASERPLVGPGSPLLASNPLLATENRGYRLHSPPTMRDVVSGMGRTNSWADDANAGHARSESGALAAAWTKLIAVAVVVTVGAVTGLLVGISGASWSIRGRGRDGSCFPMESWHLIAAWTTCAAIGGVSYVTTVEPKRPDPRAKRAKRKSTATDHRVVVEKTGGYVDGDAADQPVMDKLAPPWWIEWRRQPCLLRKEKLFVTLVSVWFGGVYLSLIARQPRLGAANGNGYLALLVIMNGVLLLSTFRLGTWQPTPTVRAVTAVELAKLQKKWGSTQSIMQNKDVAAMFRDAARAHYCEELYKFLAAFDAFEKMNLDDNVGGGDGDRDHKLPSLFGKKGGDGPDHQQNKSYQVPRYSAYVAILADFFTPGCRFEVNVSNATRSQVGKLLKFTDWVVSSEDDKREVFAKAAQEVRMMLDQNVTGYFIQSASFVSAAQTLVGTDRPAQGAHPASAGETIKRRPRNSKVKRAFQTIVAANAARKRSKVAISGVDSDIEGGVGISRPGSISSGNSDDASEVSHVEAGAPRMIRSFRVAALGIIATSRPSSGAGAGDVEELLPTIPVAAAPAPAADKLPSTTMVHVASAPP